MRQPAVSCLPGGVHRAGSEVRMLASSRARGRVRQRRCSLRACCSCPCQHNLSPCCHASPYRGAGARRRYVKRDGVRHGARVPVYLARLPLLPSGGPAGATTGLQRVVAARQQTWSPPAACDAVSRRPPSLARRRCSVQLACAPGNPARCRPPHTPQGELPLKGALQLLPCTLVRRRPPDGTAHGAAAS
jgi:hypothetical protein